MFRKDDITEKEQREYHDDAKDYIGNQKKTQRLLNKAIIKANGKKRSLGEAWNNLQLLIELVKAYSKGEYKNVSTSTILTVIGAILYFISPLDLVPDFIIGIGLIDDAAVISFTIKKLSSELAEFNKWKQSSIYPTENPLD